MLDAHVSGPRVGRPLADDGHDVLAVDQDRTLEGKDDEDLLRQAADERRILVTFDAGDFAALAREWAAAGRSHAGLALIVGVDTSELGSILRLLRGGLAERPQQEDWVDLALFLSRR
jgi:predicted nuclease of predicted toxin-antitoxin system